MPNAVPPPWERDGVSFCARGWDDHADDVWGIDEMRDVSVRTAIADFYLLDALRWDALLPRTKATTRLTLTQRMARGDRWRDCCDTQEAGPHKQWCKERPQPSAPMSDDKAAMLLTMAQDMDDATTERSLPLIMARAWTLRADIVEEVARLFRHYLHWAISGELRYERGGRLVKSFDGGFSAKNAMRAGWFKLVQHIGGAKAAEYARDLFLDGSWGPGYGGTAWANVAECLLKYETGEWEAWLFVDRVFTTQHNTGSCLNKSSGKNGLMAWEDNANNLKPYLDAHHNSDWAELGRVASPMTSDLFERYWDLADAERVRGGLPSEPNPMNYSVLSPEPTATTAPAWADEWNDDCECDMCKENAKAAAKPKAKKPVAKAKPITKPKPAKLSEMLADLCSQIDVPDVWDETGEGC